MKKITGLIICLLLATLCACALADVAIDETHFPDEQFREIVRAFDTDGDGRLSDAEIAAVTEIECKWASATSLQGVEVFIGLEYLDCSENSLTGLNISSNTKLTTVWCSGNQIGTLDVSNNPLLVQLGCANNELKALDVSNNTKLKELYCDFNQFTSLDVSSSQTLTKLVKNANRINSENGYDFWVEGNNCLYVSSDVTVKAGSFTSKPTDAAVHYTYKNGEYLLQGKEATLIGVVKTSVKKLDIPASIEKDGKTYKVTAIVPFACEGLKKLTSVSIGKNVKVIGNAAFNNCPKLETVSGGKGLTTIGASAFEKDKALVKFVFYSNVKNIGKGAFLDCSGLKTLEFRTTKLKAGNIGKNAFKNMYKKPTVICPEGMLKTYKTILIDKGVPKKAKFRE